MILDQQRRIRVSLGELEKFLARLRRILGLRGRSIGVSLVTEAQMARWNRTYRGKNRATDVLSFPADGARPSVNNPSRNLRRQKIHSRAESWNYLGDIAIAPSVARRNARQYGRTLRDELRILVLHGTLHLIGYDHETDTGQMDRREQILRRKLGLA